MAAQGPVTGGGRGHCPPSGEWLNITRIGENGLLPPLGLYFRDLELNSGNGAARTTETYGITEFSLTN